MNEPVVFAFIQARMSSSRFPGKVLAPFLGRPMVEQVIARVAEVIARERIAVATSQETSDDPLASHVAGLGIPVVRGPLDNVVARLQQCLREFPCDWFFRVCADSPLLEPRLIRRMLTHAGAHEFDLLTNTFPRTFPKGMSIEMIRSGPFAAISEDSLTLEEQEHPTQVYYRHPERFRILNIESGKTGQAGLNLSVDTREDLKRIEDLMRGGITTSDFIEWNEKPS